MNTLHDMSLTRSAAHDQGLCKAIGSDLNRAVPLMSPDMLGVELKNS